MQRIVTLAVVLGVTLNLWLYNTVIVDTFYTAPAQLAGAVVGAGDPVGTIDAIWESGGTVAGNLWTKGNAWSGFGFLLAGAIGPTAAIKLRRFRQFTGPGGSRRSYSAENRSNT